MIREWEQIRMPLGAVKKAGARETLAAMEAVGGVLGDNRKVFLDKCKAEYEARQARQNRMKTLPSYISDPVGFVRDILNEYAWSRQVRIMEAIRDNRRVAVPSCHDSGKSWLASRIAAWWISCHAPGEAFVVTTAPTTAQVRAILWREINKAHTRGNLPGRLNQTEWFLGNELVGFGRKPDDMDLSAFQGIHARYVLVLLDEACGIVKQLWDAADTLITNENSRILAIGNPDDPSSHFHTVCKPGSGFKVLPISAFDTPNFTGEQVPDSLRELLVSKIWVEEKRTGWGETSPLWTAKVLGRFPDVGEDTLISVTDIQAAASRDKSEVADGDIELGVDVARMGSDETVIYLRNGMRFTLYDKARKNDTMVVTGMVVRAIKATHATAVKIDDIGVGGGVVDRLKEIQREEREKPVDSRNDDIVNVKIYGVNVGKAASSKKQAELFLNLRAELYWHVRDLFRGGLLSIDDDDTLHSQLSSTKYEVRSKGLIKIEDKADMKKRGLPSPDRADGIMLCAAPCELFDLPDWVTQKLRSPQIAIFQM